MDVDVDVDVAQAREKWDVARQAKENGKRQKVDGKTQSMSMPLPPNPNQKKKPAALGGAAAVAAYWEIVGETYLPPHSEVPSLKERAAWVAAECIDRAPEVRRLQTSTRYMACECRT